MSKYYYYLVAGLPELTLEDSKLSYTVADFKAELYPDLSDEDRRLIDLFYLKFDNANVLKLLKDKDAAIDSRGNYSAEELAEFISSLKDGDEVVTSHVSDKFLQGLSVGYVKDIVSDPSSQTKTAHLIPSVNFDQLENVLVITQLKDNSEIKDIKNYD